ncbi:MAG: CvpA family protein [Planctomycetota bacterium]|jgi:uncharacterized membrane protein required for colicin V production
MVSLLVLLIIAGCASYQYFKGSLVRSFMLFITIILSSVPAFAFFEYVSSFIIGRDGGGKMSNLAPIAQPVCFLVIFGLWFLIFQSALSYIIKEKINLGVIAERVGSVFCGVLSGLLLSGIILTVLAMLPLPEKYPYERFSSTNPTLDNPKKAFLNADGFAVGWFNIFSKGSMSGKRSFSVLHPNFLDTTYLNRLGKSKQVSTTITGSKPVIEVPKEKGVWPAPKGLKDTSGKTIEQKGDSALTVVRIGLRQTIIQTNGTFTPLQLPLICKSKSKTKNLYKGSATVVYPIGYLKTAEQLEPKSLNSTIKLQRGDFDGILKWVDFVYFVPMDSVPILLGFKSNTILELSSPVDEKEAPEFIPFEISKPEPAPSEEPGEDEEEPEPIEESAGESEEESEPEPEPAD